jgi:hypothetical protein
MECHALRVPGSTAGELPLVEQLAIVGVDRRVAEAALAVPDPVFVTV